MKKQRFNRKQFLALSASTLGAVYMTRRAFGQSESLPQSQKESTKETGLTELFLDARYGPLNLAGRQAYLLNYNDQIPGHPISAQAGDTVGIHLINKLTKPTNLHYHGLHVSPSGNADNIFLKIP